MRRCSGGWVDGQMPRETGGTVDGRVEGGWMDGGKRRLRMGRVGGCIDGWMAHEWRAEEMGWAVQLEG